MSSYNYPDVIIQEALYIRENTNVHPRIISEWYGISEEYAMELDWHHDKENVNREAKCPDLKTLKKMKEELNEKDLCELSQGTRRKMIYYQYLYEYEGAKTNFPLCDYSSLWHWKNKNVEPVETASEAAGLDEIINRQK